MIIAIVFFVVGLVAGGALVYGFLHKSMLQTFGADVMVELCKIKERLGVGK